MTLSLNSSALRRRSAPGFFTPGPLQPSVESAPATAAARARQRADEDNRAWQAQHERMQIVIREASQRGYDAGERFGYTAGWRFGAICGGCAGAVALALVWLGWERFGGVLAAWGLA